MSREMVTRADGSLSHPAYGTVPDVQPLTDEQRARFLEIVNGDPGMGHVRAARQIGVVGSKAAIKAMLAADEELQEGVREAWRGTLKEAGLGMKHLLEKLAVIVNDDENHSQLRAIDRAFALHGGTPVVQDPVEQAESFVDDPFAVTELTIEERLVLRKRILVEHPELARIVSSRRLALDAGDVIEQED